MRDYPLALGRGFWALGNYFYNLYLVQGRDACALVEVGVSAVVDRVLEQLDALGARPDYLVVTHPHADHLTGLPGLRERFPSAAVVAAPGAREFAEHPKAAAMLQAEDPYMHRAMAERGHPPGRPPLEVPPPLADALAGRDGDVLDLGGGTTLLLREVRGHSPGNLVVHLPQQRALIAGDSLGFRFPGRYILPLYFTGYDDYVATVDRLAPLAPEILGLGHLGVAVGTEVPGVFAQARRAAADMRGRVLAWEGDPDGLAEQLFLENYRDEWRINSEPNIRNCISLLIRRSREAQGP